MVKQITVAASFAPGTIITRNGTRFRAVASSEQGTIFTQVQRGAGGIRASFERPAALRPPPKFAAQQFSPQELKQAKLAGLKAGELSASKEIKQLEITTGGLEGAKLQKFRLAQTELAREKSKIDNERTSLESQLKNLNQEVTDFNKKQLALQKEIKVFSTGVTPKLFSTLQNKINQANREGEALNQKLKSFNEKQGNFEGKIESFNTAVQASNRIIQAEKIRTGQAKTFTELKQIRAKTIGTLRKPLTPKEVSERQVGVTLPSAEDVISGLIDFPRQVLQVAPEKGAREFKAAGELGFEEFFGTKTADVFGFETKETVKAGVGISAGIIGGLTAPFGAVFTPAIETVGQASQFVSEQALTGVAGVTGVVKSIETPPIKLGVPAFDFLKSVGGIPQKVVTDPITGDKTAIFKLGKSAITKTVGEVAKIATEFELLLGFPLTRLALRPLTSRIIPTITRIKPSVRKTVVRTGEIGGVPVSEAFSLQRFETIPFLGLGKGKEFDQFTQLIAVSPQARVVAKATKRGAKTPLPRPLIEAPVPPGTPTEITALRQLIPPVTERGLVVSRAAPITRVPGGVFIDEAILSGNVPTIQRVNERILSDITGQSFIRKVKKPPKGRLPVKVGAEGRSLEEAIIGEFETAKAQPFKGLSLTEISERQIITEGLPPRAVPKLLIEKPPKPQTISESLKELESLLRISEPKPLAIELGTQKIADVLLFGTAEKGKVVGKVFDTKALQDFISFPSLEVTIAKTVGKISERKTGLTRLFSEALGKPAQEFRETALILPRVRIEPVAGEFGGTFAGIKVRKPTTKALAAQRQITGQQRDLIESFFATGPESDLFKELTKGLKKIPKAKTTTSKFNVFQGSFTKQVQKTIQKLKQEETKAFDTQLQVIGRAGTVTIARPKTQVKTKTELKQEQKARQAQRARETQRLKTQDLIGTTQRSRNLFAPLTGFREKAKSRQRKTSKSLLSGFTSFVPRSTEKSVLLPASALKSLQANLTKPLQAFKPLTITKTLTVTTPKPITTPRPTPPPIIPGLPLLFPPLPGLQFGFPRAEKPGQAFNVSVKSKGRFQKINKRPLTRGTALGLGSDFVDRGVERTFGITRTRGKPKSIPGLERAFNPLKFRQPKGKTKLPRDVFVEKSAFAIDTPTELQGITFKGLIALERNRNIRRILKKPRGKQRRKIRRRARPRALFTI